MKKVYIITKEGNVEFVFTSKKRAEKQLEFIKESIISGKWFLDKDGNYLSHDNFEFLENYTIYTIRAISYCFLNKKNGNIISYNLFEKDVNSSYGI